MRAKLLVAGQWCAVASLFVVPLNKPATNVALVLSVLFSVLGSDARQRWLAASRSPIARGALIWWAMLMLSWFHAWFATGTRPLTGTAIWACWYPLVFASLLLTPQWRRRALLALALSTTLVMLASYGMDLGLIPQRAVALEMPTMRNTVFKEYTQQGLSTLILGAMALSTALVVSNRWRRTALAALAVLALANVLLVIESRTAYLVLVPLALYWVWRWARRERWGLLALAALVVATPAMAWYTPTIHQRLLRSMEHGIHAYVSEREPSSVGIRLELWRRTIPIVESAPWFGHGYRQWKPLYRQSIEGLPDFDSFMMGHPHQEMLWILSEQGLVGLLVWLGLLVALARYIVRLDSPERGIYASALLIYFVAGLGNCLWLDFSHRHLFILLLACIPPAAARRPAGRIAHGRP
ncbi:MAG: hypothetical protein RSP_29590 [Rhodanobacter sp.]